MTGPARGAATGHPPRPSVRPRDRRAPHRRSRRPAAHRHSRPIRGSLAGPGGLRSVRDGAVDRPQSGRGGHKTGSPGVTPRSGFALPPVDTRLLRFRVAVGHINEIGSTLLLGQRITCQSATGDHGQYEAA